MVLHLKIYKAVPKKTRKMSNETQKPDLFVTVVMLVLGKTATINLKF